MTIEERIERLERTNRRYRIMFTLIGVIAVCAVGISATQDDKVPDVIQARSFVAVDEQGRALVNIAASNGEGTVIVSAVAEAGKGPKLILTKDFTPVVGLGIQENSEGYSGFISGWNSDGKTFVTIGQLTKGENKGKGFIQTERFQAVNEHHELRAALFAQEGAGGLLILGASDAKQGPTVILGNEKGGVLVALGTSGRGDDRSGDILTSTSKGEVLLFIHSSKDGGGIVETFGSNGEPLVKLSSMGWGGGVVVVSNNSGVPAVLITTDEQNDGLVSLYDHNRKARILTVGP